MALDARRRSSIYEKLVPLIGADDANALMSEFPSVEADELVTKQFLRAELALTRGELRQELGELRREMTTMGGELRTEMTALGGALRTDMTALGGELRTEMTVLGGALRTEMAERFRQQTVWLGGAIGASTTSLAALVTLT